MNALINSAYRGLRRLTDARKTRQWRVKHLGIDSHLSPNVQVIGWEQVRIGHHTILGDGTWLNVNHRGSDDPAIVIGDNCYIGRRNFISSGASIIVGDYCLTGADCRLIGADHLHTSPFAPYITTGASSGGVIELGPNCWLGTSVTVLKNVKIGYGSIVGAAAIVTHDLPPFSMAVGSPARVIRRFDVRQAAWVPTEKFPPNGEEYFPGEDVYLQDLRIRFPKIKGPLIASSPEFGDL
jgi:acetyltransferase-like isoleucine patch superfamily enzyme